MDNRRVDESILQQAAPRIARFNRPSIRIRETMATVFLKEVGTN